MKTSFNFPAVVAFVALFFFVFTAQVQAQGYDDVMSRYSNMDFNNPNTWSQESKQTYDKYNNMEFNMNNPEVKKAYDDLMQRVTETYNRTVAENTEIMNQIIANAEANAKVVEKQLLAIGAQTYANALASGYSNIAAQKLAVSNINSLAQTNSSLSGIGSSMSSSIMNNWPNGGSYYYVKNGQHSNW
jgi:hypothetical protein